MSKTEQEKQIPCKCDVEFQFLPQWVKVECMHLLSWDSFHILHWNEASSSAGASMTLAVRNRKSGSPEFSLPFRFKTEKTLSFSSSELHRHPLDCPKTLTCELSKNHCRFIVQIIHPGPKKTERIGEISTCFASHFWKCPLLWSSLALLITRLLVKFSFFTPPCSSLSLWERF